MNQHLGATYTLSVLIVVGFALLMSRSEPGPLIKPEVVVKKTAPTPIANPKADTVADGRVMKNPEPPSRGVIEGSTVRQVSHVRTAPRSQPLRGFATVSAGESLADVAQRVYGSADAVHKLWRANRDQLPDQATPPRTGMILRTP